MPERKLPECAGQGGTGKLFDLESAFLFIVLAILTVLTRNLEDIRDCAYIHTYWTCQQIIPQVGHELLRSLFVIVGPQIPA